MKVVKHCKQVPRQAAVSSSLEIFSTELDKDLSPDLVVPALSKELDQRLLEAHCN